MIPYNADNDMLHIWCQIRRNGHKFYHYYIAWKLRFEKKNSKLFRGYTWIFIRGRGQIRPLSYIISLFWIQVCLFLLLLAKAAKQDIETERETYKTSREGLDNMYTDLKKKLEEETHVRLVSDKLNVFDPLLVILCILR